MLLAQQCSLHAHRANQLLAIHAAKTLLQKGWPEWLEQASLQVAGVHGLLMHLAAHRPASTCSRRGSVIWQGSKNARAGALQLNNADLCCA